MLSLNAQKAKKTVECCQHLDSKLATLPKPRPFFSKPSMPCNRHSVQGGRISVMQRYNCQCFGHSAKSCRSKQMSDLRGENHSYKGCPEHKKKTGVQATCGQQPKDIRLSCKPKHPPTASDIYFYCRTTYQIRSKRSYPNRPTTCLLSKPKARHTGPEV